MKKNLFFKAGAMLCAVMMFAACGGGDDEGGGTAVTGVTVSPTSKTLAIGETVTLVATVAPSSAIDKSVTWSVVPATGVVTVSNTGLVTAVGNGPAVVTVTTTDGNKTATCNITVGGGSTTPSAITIDGDFADWAALSATAAPKAEYTPHTETNVASQLKVVRSYINADYVYVYVEYTDTPDKIYVLHVHIDADNSKDTGTTTDDGAWYFDGGVEYICEGHILDEATGTGVSYDPGIHSWAEFPGGAYFGQVDVAGGSLVGEGSITKALDNGNMALEVQLMRAMFPPSLVWGTEVGIGVDIAEVGWAERGRVPNNADASAATMLVVPITTE